jgi:signal peptidase
MSSGGWGTTAGGWVRRSLLVAVVALVFALALGQVLGQPVALGYVETGSMAPALRPGDGFVAIPAALTAVTPGDVVVYDATALNRGGLVTHRVVDETPEGFVTRGDANTFSDQESAGEPPVTDAQVRAEVLQVGGRVVAIPYLGTAVGAVHSALASVRTALGGVPLVGPWVARNLGVVLFVGGAGTYLASLVLPGARTRARSGAVRDRIRRPRTVPALVLLAGAAVVLAATALMVVPGGVTTYDVVSADIDAPGPRVIPRGSFETTTHEVVAGPVGVVAFLEPSSPRIDLDRRTVFARAGATATATVTLVAPPDNGYYRQHVVEHRYLAVLPLELVRALYGVHPWLPLVATDVLVGAPFVGVAAVLARRGSTPGRPRPRRNGWLPRGWRR